MPAFRSPRSLVLFLAATGLGCAADLLSKHFVFATLLGTGKRPEVVPGLLRLTLSANPGIVFGIRLPPWLVMLATLAAVAAVVVLFAASARTFWGLHLALGMVLGGALGNAYDRLVVRVQLPGETASHAGRVRDFLDVYPIRYPIFNVADVLLVVGVALILLHVLRTRRAAPA